MTTEPEDTLVLEWSWAPIDFDGKMTVEQRAQGLAAIAAWAQWATIELERSPAAASEIDETLRALLAAIHGVRASRSPRPLHAQRDAMADVTRTLIEHALACHDQWRTGLVPEARADLVFEAVEFHTDNLYESLAPRLSDAKADVLRVFGREPINRNECIYLLERVLSGRKIVSPKSRSGLYGSIEDRRAAARRFDRRK